MEFPRQQYWSGLPFPSPRDLPQPRDGIQVSCITGRFFTLVNLPYYVRHSNAILIHFLKLQYFSTEDKSNPYTYFQSRNLPGSSKDGWREKVGTVGSQPFPKPTRPSSLEPFLTHEFTMAPVHPEHLQAAATTCLTQFPPHFLVPEPQYKPWHRPPGLEKVTHGAQHGLLLEVHLTWLRKPARTVGATGPRKSEHPASYLSRRSTALYSLWLLGGGAS